MHTLRSSALRAGSVLVALFFLVPVAHAAAPDTTGVDNLGTFLLKGIYFSDRYLVPLIFALAFIVFIIGVYRFFIAGATNEEKRKEGQTFVVYGLIGFVLMLSVWGIVNLLLNSLGFERGARPDLPLFGAPMDNTDSSNPFAKPTSNTDTNTADTNPGDTGHSTTQPSAPDGSVPDPYKYGGQY